MNESELNIGQIFEVHEISFSIIKITEKRIHAVGSFKTNNGNEVFSPVIRFKIHDVLQCINPNTMD